jgi:hypothetical protein
MGPSPAGGPPSVLGTRLSLACSPGVRWKSPVASRGVIARRRRRVLVAGGQPSTMRLAFTPPGSPTRPELAFGPTWPALSTVALDASARRRAGWPAIGLAVTPRWGARATNVLARGRLWASA